MFPSFIKIKTTLNSEYGSSDAVLHPPYLFMKAQSNKIYIGQTSLEYSYIKLHYVLSSFNTT